MRTARGAPPALAEHGFSRFIEDAGLAVNGYGEPELD